RCRAENGLHQLLLGTKPAGSGHESPADGRSVPQRRSLVTRGLAGKIGICESALALARMLSSLARADGRPGKSWVLRGERSRRRGYYGYLRGQLRFTAMTANSKDSATDSAAEVSPAGVVNRHERVLDEAARQLNQKGVLL